MQSQPAAETPTPTPFGFDPGLKCLTAVLLFTVVVRVLLTFVNKTHSVTLIKLALSLVLIGLAGLVLASYFVWGRRNRMDRPVRRWAVLLAMVWVSLQLTTYLVIGFQAFTAPAAASVADEQRSAILELAERSKKAIIAKDHGTFVALLYPEMVMSIGGPVKVIQTLKAEDAKNKAAGIVMESLDFALTDSMHVGSEFTVTFLTSTMVVATGSGRLRSRSFFVAFSPIGGRKWYLMDGTQMTKEQFQKLFRGLPDDLELPSVERTSL